jgi:IstB-like ATP binding protein
MANTQPSSLHNFWYDVIGEKTVADAILDRLVTNAQRLELKGESLR